LAVSTARQQCREFGFKPFLDVSEQDLEHYWAVNLKGTYLTTQAAVRT